MDELWNRNAMNKRYMNSVIDDGDIKVTYGILGAWHPRKLPSWNNLTRYVY